MKHQSIADAKNLAKRDGKTGVVIFHYDEESNTFGYSSYGKNKEWCQKMRRFGDETFDLVMDKVIKIT